MHPDAKKGFRGLNENRIKKSCLTLGTYLCSCQCSGEKNPLTHPGRCWPWTFHNSIAHLKKMLKFLCVFFETSGRFVIWSQSLNGDCLFGLKQNRKSITKILGNSVWYFRPWKENEWFFFMCTHWAFGQFFGYYLIMNFEENWIWISVPRNEVGNR